MREYFEVINIVYIYSEEVHGTVESLGAYASIVKYQKDGFEYEELLDNEDFVIMDEIVLQHFEEEK